MFCTRWWRWAARRSSKSATVGRLSSRSFGKDAARAGRPLSDPEYCIFGGVVELARIDLRRRIGPLPVNRAPDRLLASDALGIPERFAKPRSIWALGLLPIHRRSH